MSASSKETIPCGARFTNGQITVMKDQVFGWVLLRKEEGGEEEAFTFDELEEVEFIIIVDLHLKEEVFPEELREFVRKLDPRPNDYRKLH